MNNKITMEDITNYCKNYGYVFSGFYVNGVLISSNSTLQYIIPSEGTNIIELKYEKEVSIIKNALVFGYIEEIRTLYPSNYIVFWHTSVSSNFTAMIKCDRLQHDNVRYNLENPEELKKFIVALNGFKSILKEIKKQTKEICKEIEEQILEDFLNF